MKAFHSTGKRHHWAVFFNHALRSEKGELGSWFSNTHAKGNHAVREATLEMPNPLATFFLEFGFHVARVTEMGFEFSLHLPSVPSVLLPALSGTIGSSFAAPLFFNSDPFFMCLCVLSRFSATAACGATRATGFADSSTAIH